MLGIVSGLQRRRSLLVTATLGVLASLSLSGCGWEALHSGSSSDSSSSSSSTDKGTVTSTTSGASTNKPPVISGAPSMAAEVGKVWNFTPTASDPESDPLTFTIANKPNWMGFDTATGALSGTPASSDAHLWANITISVSDGKISSSLTPFSVTVAAAAVAPPAATAHVTLAWVPPNTNEDATVLTDLAGYKVYYGKAANTLDQIIRVTNPAASGQVVDKLVSGTWFFAVTALSSSGAESALSSVVSKTIP